MGRAPGGRGELQKEVRSFRGNGDSGDGYINVHICLNSNCTLKTNFIVNKVYLNKVFLKNYTSLTKTSTAS